MACRFTGSTVGTGATLINATDGSVVVISKRDAEKLARKDITGRGEVLTIETSMAPDSVISMRMGPNNMSRYWRVSFSDSIRSTLYISASTGDILLRRNNYGRIYEFAQKLHFMNYLGPVDDFINALIVVVALTAIWLGISGFILLFGSFKRSDFSFLRLWRIRDEPASDGALS